MRKNGLLVGGLALLVNSLFASVASAKVDDPEVAKLTMMMDSNDERKALEKADSLIKSGRLKEQDLAWTYLVRGHCKLIFASEVHGSKVAALADIEKARQMKPDRDLLAEIYVNLMGAYMDDGNNKEILKCADLLNKATGKPTSRAYVAMVIANCGLGRPDLATESLKKAEACFDHEQFLRPEQKVSLQAMIASTKKSPIAQKSSVEAGDSASAAVMSVEDKKTQVPKVASGDVTSHAPNVSVKGTSGSIAEINKLYNQGKFSQCVFAAEAAIRADNLSDDDRLTAYRRKGQSQNHLGLYAGAIYDLKKAIAMCARRPKDHADIAGALAEAHFSEGDMATALASCDDALKVNKQGSLYFLRAKIEEKKGDLKSALSDCDLALKHGGCVSADVQALKRRLSSRIG